MNNVIIHVVQYI